jgi:hypothetical protein
MGGEGISMAAWGWERFQCASASRPALQTARNPAIKPFQKNPEPISVVRKRLHQNRQRESRSDSSFRLKAMSTTIDLRPLARASSAGGVDGSSSNGEVSDAGGSSSGNSGGSNDSSSACLAAWTRLMGFTDQPHRFNDQVICCFLFWLRQVFLIFVSTSCTNTNSYFSHFRI